jgi:elongation factor G
VTEEVREKLDSDAILMQLPIGIAEDFEGVIDLVRMQAIYFDGEHGETVREEEIPERMLEQAEEARMAMLERLAMYSDKLMEGLLNEKEISETLIHDVTRDAVQQLNAAPVFLGSAFKNKGVQPLLDAVIRYLPSPLEREITASSCSDPEQPIVLSADPADSFVGMAFKLVDDAFGQLTFMRIYQGTVSRGETYVNQRTGNKERFSRIYRMHSDKRVEIDKATAGDIVAVMGIDAVSGDTYASTRDYCTLESIYVPPPVITIAVSPQNRNDVDRLGKALARFRKEDPTFQVRSDKESGEILIAGMGELHLEVYLERIRREYQVVVQASAPQVSYREAPTVAATYNYKHKKQTGGSGQYAHIIGTFEPLPLSSEMDFEFEENVVGGRVPKQFIPSVQKGFRECLVKGPLADFPVIGLKTTLDDGSFHDVDSSDKAFQLCARRCFRETFKKTKPVLLEPIMKVEIECPASFQGVVTGDLASRRGIIASTSALGKGILISGQVPLAETFGYATDLRSLTQGQGTFTLELHTYRRVPSSIQQEIIAERAGQKMAPA